MKEIIWQQVIKSGSKKRFLNLIKSLTSLVIANFSEKKIIFGIPPVLTIEPTAVCNLRCPQCLTGLGKLQRDESFLPFELYKKVIDEIGDELWYLLLYNQGEPFLHPQFIEMVRLAKKKRIYVTTSTNGHFFADETSVKKLIDSGIDSIIVSLDGADAATYSEYRRGGDFAAVVEGIRRLIKARNAMKSKTPYILIQCLITKSTEKQLAEVKKLARSLRVNRVLFKTFQVEDENTAAQFLPENAKWRRYDFAASEGRLLHPKVKGPCHRLWYSTVILSDGRVVPCCFDKNGNFSFGNIQNATLKEIWTSDEYQQFRKAVRKKSESIPICQNCSRAQKVFQ